MNSIMQSWSGLKKPPLSMSVGSLKSSCCGGTGKLQDQLVRKPVLIGVSRAIFGPTFALVCEPDHTASKSVAMSMKRQQISTGVPSAD